MTSANSAPTPSNHSDEPLSTVDALITDYQQSDHKLQTASVGAGTLVTLGAGAVKAPTVALPLIESGSTALMHSKPLMALTVGALYAGWTRLTAAPINRLRHEFPNTASAVSANHPKVTKMVDGVATVGAKLPGFEQAVEEDMAERGKIRRLGKTALTRISRGFSATFVSTTAYIAGANLTGQSDDDVNKLTRNVAVEAGAVNAATATLMSEMPGYVKFGSIGAIIGTSVVRNIAQKRRQV